MSSRLRGWRPALRIARRDASRARGRSILVLVMIGLPVLAIVALDTLGRTSDITVREGLDRQLGSADAIVHFQGSSTAVDQDPELDIYTSAEDAPEVPRPTRDTVRSVLGPGSTVIPLREGEVALRTSAGLARPAAVEVDLRSPLAKGLFLLDEGRLPRSTDEVAVSGRLSARGFPVGAEVRLADGGTRQVVGIVESASTRDLSLVVGRPGALGVESADFTSWLVDRPGGVDWAAVRDLNAEGLYALSRSVVEDPPPPSEVTVEEFGGGSLGAAAVTVLALVVAMALLEVVLLAGPAFAVGARRQQRSLALLAATGGEPPDVRRVVLASGVVLGSTAAVLGAVGGIGVAWLARPGVQQFSSTRLGPFEVSLRDTVAIAACGLLSALLAALAPALLAARQDVVAVLAGRRGESRPTKRSPAIGAVLLLGGVGTATYGARQASAGEVFITGAAIASVLGMVLLIPLVVSLLGRVARLLPLPLRFAVRDAARHRSRTSPAVAAVAATVAGVVALGIGASSDAAQSRATYTPSAPLGAAVVNAYKIPDEPATDWTALGAVVRRQLPDARVRPVRGVPDEGDIEPGSDLGPESLLVEAVVAEGAPVETSYAGRYGAAVLVGADSLRTMRLELSGAERTRARRTLADGGVVVFGHSDRAVTSARLVRQRYPADGGEVAVLGSYERPATLVTVPGSQQPAIAIVSEDALVGTGLAARTTALVVDGTDIDTAAEDAISEAVSGIDANAYVFVERGFQDNSTRVILLLLGSIGGVLVLGGTLTATFLALSDARPDFATMGAVGAAPRTRRFVAAAYAGTIGLVGAVLGAVVGFVPGIAVTFPLTSSSWLPEGSTDSAGVPLPDHFLDIPWLLVAGLVVILPLVTALVVGLTSRSRLPMVGRLS